MEKSSNQAQSIALRSLVASEGYLAVALAQWFVADAELSSRRESEGPTGQFGRDELRLGIEDAQ
jgi:hypothetical protein